MHLNLSPRNKISSKITKKAEFAIQITKDAPTLLFPLLIFHCSTLSPLAAHALCLLLEV